MGFSPPITSSIQLGCPRCDGVSLVHSDLGGREIDLDFGTEYRPEKQAKDRSGQEEMRKIVHTIVLEDGAGFFRI